MTTSNDYENLEESSTSEALGNPYEYKIARDIREPQAIKLLKLAGFTDVMQTDFAGDIQHIDIIAKFNGIPCKFDHKGITPKNATFGKISISNAMYQWIFSGKCPSTHYLLFNQVSNGVITDNLIIIKTNRLQPSDFIQKRGKNSEIYYLLDFFKLKARHFSDSRLLNAKTYQILPFNFANYDI